MIKMEEKKPKKKKVNITCEVPVATVHGQVNLFTTTYFDAVKELAVEEIRKNKDYKDIINLDSLSYDIGAPFYSDEMKVMVKCGFNCRVGNKTKSLIKGYLIRVSLPILLKTTKRFGEIISSI